MGMLLLKPARFGYINAKCRTLKADLLDDAFYEKALQSEGLGDIFTLLKSTAYAPYIKDAEKESIESGVQASFENLYTKSLSVLKKEESAIFELFFRERKRLAAKQLPPAGASGESLQFQKGDLEYIGKLKKALTAMEREQKRDLSKILGSYFDILNLYTVVRLRILYRLEPEEIVPFLVPYGLELDMKVLAAAAGMTTLSEISDTVHEKIGSAFSGYHEFRHALAEYHLRMLRRVWYGYPFKLSVIFSLLRMKEIEVKNIRSLAEGLFYRLPREEIAKMLVGV